MIETSLIKNGDRIPQLEASIADRAAWVRQDRLLDVYGMPGTPEPVER